MTELRGLGYVRSWSQQADLSSAANSDGEKIFLLHNYYCDHKTELKMNVAALLDVISGEVNQETGQSAREENNLCINGSIISQSVIHISYHAVYN